MPLFLAAAEHEGGIWALFGTFRFVVDPND